MTKLIAIAALLLAAIQPAHASGAPVPDVLIDLLLTPGGWAVLGIAAVSVIALIVKTMRD